MRKCSFSDIKDHRSAAIRGEGAGVVWFLMRNTYIKNSKNIIKKLNDVCSLSVLNKITISPLTFHASSQYCIIPRRSNYYKTFLINTQYSDL